MTAELQIDALLRVLRGFPRVAVAVSGGVDSMTLATLAHRHAGVQVEMFHAVSPAVPREATSRVLAASQQDSWILTIFDAGEFTDEQYRANPVNRCFYCKMNLYDSIAARSSAPIVSGTNVDDLSEYRPGLQAASVHAVRHPYVDAGIDKRAVRSIARWLGLQEIANLPASPCLSSRIETGIGIDPIMLELVHEVERLITRRIKPQTARCRVRAAGVVIELDHDSLARLDSSERADIRGEVLALLRRGRFEHDVWFESYRVGSAFVQPDALP